MITSKASNFAMKTVLSSEIRKMAENQARFCKVFSNPQRILILWFLANGESTFGEIAAAIGLSKPRTAQHLQRMKLGNIVEVRREKKNTYYRIANDRLVQDWLNFTNK